MQHLYTATTVNIDLNLIIGVIGTLSGVIGVVSGVLWKFTMSRLKKQDELIEAQRESMKQQDKSIETLSDEVKRLSRGCGVAGCKWNGL